LFIKHDISDEKAREIANELKNHIDIESVKLINRSEALKEYRQYSGFNDALAVLDENPLPNVILVRPNPELISNGKSEQLLTFIREYNEVEAAQYDRQWVNRLFVIIKIVQHIVFIVSILLGFAVLLIVGNTARLAIHNRRSEIEINKLFGATNAFMQRPLLYSGSIELVSLSVPEALIL